MLQAHRAMYNWGITATGLVVADAIGWDSDEVFSHDWNGDGVSE